MALAAEAGRRPGGGAQAMDALRDQRGVPLVAGSVTISSRGQVSARDAGRHAGRHHVARAGDRCQTAIFSIVNRLLLRTLPVDPRAWCT